MSENENSAEKLQKLHPDHVKVTRITAGILMAIIALPLILFEGSQFINNGVQILPMGSSLLIWVAIAFFFIIILPMRRYLHRGYHMEHDRIRIVRGYLFHSDTIVPFGRIQHIDVNQGPIQRRYDLASLTVHTAGNHNNSVTLPGLLHANAIVMREEIRAHIKRESI